jgi:hypothetical protein
LDRTRQLLRHIWQQALLGLLQTGLGGVQLIGVYEHERVEHTKGWAYVDESRRQRVEPAKHCVDQATVCDGPGALFDQTDGGLPIVCLQRMLNRFRQQFLVLKPPVGTTVQRRHIARGRTAV